MRDQIISLTREKRVIAIVRGIAPEQGLETAQALYDGGIRMIEVTFNQKDPSQWKYTTDMIRAIDDHFGGKVAVGAGTVTTPELVQLAHDAGAKYIISPDAKEAVIRLTRQLGLVSMPGALTPTEITTAWDCGADFVKLFPVNALGIGYIKSLLAPLNHIPLLAVGGIDLDNVRSYLDAGCVGAGIGGSLVNTKWIASGEFEKITATAAALVKTVEK